ncbi:MAG TPA: alanine racemase [Paracoccaceae bacterium]|nr:alanine racemase [Paracoccaceae bacterium]
MARARLTIDLDAILANWRALDAKSGPLTETGAVLKADAYGLGAERVGRALARAGVKTFFVALAEEGAALREALGEGPEIVLLSGPMEGDRALIAEARLVPILNSPAQLHRLAAELPGHACALQIDTGMNRLGFEPVELAMHLFEVLAARPRLVMSHLACADTPHHAMNALQLAAFHSMTLALAGIRRSLASTGGILLGPFHHFDLTRPGIGLFGGLPFADARPVVSLSLPVIQVRDVLPGEGVGYGLTFMAGQPRRVATVAAGYADGLFRALSGRAELFAGTRACPVLGRVSMDLIGVDVTGLPEVPETLEILGPAQGIDRLAAAAGTIGYEVLTSLGSRYARVYKGGESDAQDLHGTRRSV